jgi:beta-1,4-mannosyltransferase
MQEFLLAQLGALARMKRLPNSMDYQQMAKVSILAWPARRNKDHNTYTQRLYDSLDKDAFLVLEFSPRRAMFAPYEILHIHWPDGVLKTGSRSRAVWMTLMMLAVLLYVAHVRRKPIVWTVHNLQPHAPRYPALWKIISWALARTVTYLIHLSNAASDQMTLTLPDTADIPRSVIYHGRYEGEYVAQASRAITRQSLGISESSYVFAFLGYVSEYKGALELAEAFRGLRLDLDVVLIIAGACENENYKQEIRRLESQDDRIIFLPDFLGAHKFADFAVASDIVVLPYKSILNSGSIFVPLELAKPVLAPSLGSIPEMRDLLGQDWVKTYEGVISSTELERNIGHRPTDVPRLDAFNWLEIAMKTESLYAKVLAERLRPQVSSRRPIKSRIQWF